MAEDDPYTLQQDAGLEIFITNACNQHCEYCYLTKYDGLYPHDLRSPELLLNNLRKLYDWILNNKMTIPKCEFFTGEIWQTQFGLDILELTYEYICKGMEIQWILIASNCSFVNDPVQLQKIQTYIDKFDDGAHQLSFSISLDGAIIENEMRPLNSTVIKDDEYYENIFNFAKHNNFYFHPMVASKSSKHWIENYKWWAKKFKEYDFDIDELMMLEVRNSDWTEESINDYNNFMNYLIEDAFNRCGRNVEIFSNTLMGIRNKAKNLKLSGYIPWAFPEADSFFGCTVATDLCVRLGDLAICPCHRTSYDKYVYGKFVLDENGDIFTVTANNTQMAVKILMGNLSTTMNKCDTCVFNPYCLKGCAGSQIESTGDPFIPSGNVCNFFHKKYSFLLSKYRDMGVIDYLKENITKYEADYPIVKKFLDFYQRWEEEVCGTI